jgi:hypothetical protein
MARSLPQLKNRKKKFLEALAEGKTIFVAAKKAGVQSRMALATSFKQSRSRVTRCWR